MVGWLRGGRSTAGVGVGNEGIEGVEEEAEEEDEGVVEQVHEVQPHSHSQFYVVDVCSEADLSLVHDIAAATAKLQLVAVLSDPPDTLLLSRSMRWPCSVSKSKFPSRLALRCAMASSRVG